MLLITDPVLSVPINPNMILKVKTIRTETIKRSSPTPQHLHSLPLSSLDQASPQIYNHIIVFYSINTCNSPDQLPLSLKTSLSQTLNQFYPLAGRIRLSPSNTLHVDCRDHGVEFIESQTESDFNMFLLDPPIDQFDKLLPVKVTEFRWAEDPLLAVQLTRFNSKGLALGISISHMIADGASLAMFLNCWSNCARFKSSELQPWFNSASIFPPQSQLTNRPMPEKSPDFNINRNVLIKRFVISFHAINKLRKDYYERSKSPTPTRVEAVSALVWRCLNRLRHNFTGNMTTSVNLRRKMLSSGLSDCSVGNVYICVTATADSNKCEQVKVEESVRNAVRRVDEEYVRTRERLGWGDVEKVDVGWIFSSWCRMGLYKGDFGWGEPVWVGCGIRDMKDVCILIDTKDGDGIEVWLWLEKEEMDKIKSDEEFIQFVSS